MNYKSRAWRALRKQVLVRDRYTCQLRCSPRCTPTTNLCVDHTDELWEGGAEIPHLTRLRTACRSCNSAKHMERMLRPRTTTGPSRDW